MDLLTKTPHFLVEAGADVRPNARLKLVVGPCQDDIKGKTVLDLAAHDGRWAYAAAGAQSVVAVEACNRQVKKFKAIKNDVIAAMVEMYQADVSDFLENLKRRKQTFDCVALLVFFCHTMGHTRLLRLIKSLQPN